MPFLGVQSTDQNYTCQCAVRVRRLSGDSERSRTCRSERGHTRMRPQPRDTRRLVGSEMQQRLGHGQQRVQVKREG